jgi:hypothetical protein
MIHSPERHILLFRRPKSKDTAICWVIGMQNSKRSPIHITLVSCSVQINVNFQFHRLLWIFTFLPIGLTRLLSPVLSITRLPLNSVRVIIGELIWGLTLFNALFLFLSNPLKVKVCHKTL